MGDGGCRVEGEGVEEEIDRRCEYRLFGGGGRNFVLQIIADVKKKKKK